jgi:heme oxygenase (biliverdin-producing, ferredoxin)
VTQTLPDRLKAETRALHTSVERSVLMRALLGSGFDRAAYVALLRALHTIYAALEEALAAQAGHPAIAPLRLPGLDRAAALASDLDVLHGPGWADALPAGPEALIYARHLQQLARAQPERLVAHAYVRYLGDLNGGRVLQRRIAIGLQRLDGAAFYDFGGEDRAARLARDFRAALAGLAPEAGDAVVDEARRAFEMHQRLFDEIARRHLPAAALSASG